MLHIGVVVFRIIFISGLAVLILATFARIFMPSAIIILLLRFITIAKVFLSIFSTVVFGGKPRDFGAKYLVIEYTTKKYEEPEKINVSLGAERLCEFPICSVPCMN